MNNPPDPEFFLKNYRNQVRAALGAIFSAKTEVAKIMRMREDSHDCVVAMKSRYGAVRGQQVAEEFGHDSTLARLLLESLSGSELGKLLRTYALQCIDMYPSTDSPRDPPRQAA